MYHTLELKAQAPVAELWLNRPERLNALSLQTLEEIREAAEQLDARKDIRALIIGGRGRAFSAGADLEGFPAPTDAGAREAADAGRRMADALEGMRAITIARVQGWCVGGGLVLAAACDLRVASACARFSIPEIDLGIPLAWGGIPRLVREIGPALTKELVITCRPFDAAEAKSAGFLNRVAPLAQLDEAVHELAGDVAARPAFPVEATKRHVNAVTASATGLQHSWSDASGLLAGLVDPECARAREHYLQRRRTP